MGRASGLIYGIGVNDADYIVQPTINGRQVACNFYITWRNMIKRCYDSISKNKNPTYDGCTVCDEWLVFSNFKLWMERQDWQGNQLDKDLLIVGNRVYYPDACVFLAPSVNSFLIDRGRGRGEYPLGVNWNKGRRKFAAQCSNPFKNKSEHIGLFDCPDEAHQAWRKRKHYWACQLADLQTDQRVANSLRTRYL